MKNVLVKRLGSFLATYATLIVSLSLLTGALLFLVIPAVREAAAFRSETDEVKSLNENRLQTKLGLLAGLEPDNLKATVNQLELIVPSRRSVGLIFATLEELARQSGVRLTGLQHSAGLPAAQSAGDSTESAAGDGVSPKAQLVNLSFIASGSPSQLAGYLLRLRNTAPFFKVNKLSYSHDVLMRSGAGGETIVRDQMTVGLTSTYLPLPSELGAIEESLPGLTPTDQELLDVIYQFQPVLSFLSPAGPAAETEVRYGRPNPFE